MKIVRIKSQRAPFYKYLKEYGSFEIMEQYPLSFVPKIEQFYIKMGRVINRVIMNPKVKKIDADILFLNDDITPEQVGYIRLYNPDLPIVLRYSNPVKNALFKPDQYRPYDVVLSSFQKSDCDIYQMNYSPAYFDGIPKDSVPNDILFDAVYFGRDKGRTDLVKLIDENLTLKGYKTYIHISTDSNNMVRQKGYKNILPYDKVCRYYLQSKAIIDIQQKFQDGLDIRAIAAIMYDKKLIINNPQIKDLSFYSPSNVFIVGVDNLDSIGEFMEKPLHGYSTETKEIYSQSTFTRLLAEWTGISN